jgi:uncharacterized membrane protein (DUF373 family)
MIEQDREQEYRRGREDAGREQKPRNQSVAEAIADEEEETGTPEQKRKINKLDPFFDGALLIIYTVIAFLLLALAVAAVGYALYSIPKNLDKGVPQAIATLLSELLLVLILVEILRTVLSYLTNQTPSIRPFLTVAAISAVRRILSIGAELTLIEDLPDREFNRAMIELGAETGIILIVAIALYLFSRREGGT